MEKELFEMFNDFWKGLIGLIPEIIIAVVVIIITIFIARKLSRLIINRLVDKIDDPLLANFIGKITKWSITLIGIVISMEILGMAHFASGLIAGAGVSAIVLGFALKDIGENFLAGVILAFNRPFNIGDVVESEGILGSIKSMDLRTTTIKTFDGIEIYVPNSKILNNPLSNYNAKGFRRFNYVVGIDYDADVSKARSLILKELEAITGILNDPVPFVIVSELGANSVNLKVYFWINTDDPNNNLMDIQSEAVERSLRTLKENGVNIPFDSMQVQFSKGIPEIPVNIVNSSKN